MNQKNSLGLNKCFLDLDDPFQLFERWFAEAKSKEINDPNALALGTANKEGIPSVRMVLLKGFDQNGFIFYTNLNSQKGKELKENPNASMCFHWKSLLRQIRIVGTLQLVDKKTADDYYNTRAYESRIGAWASKQSSILKNRDELLKNLDNFKKKYNVIKACYQKAEHYINLASNSLSVFNDCEEKNILENLTSFSLSRNF